MRTGDALELAMLVMRSSRRCPLLAWALACAAAAFLAPTPAARAQVNSTEPPDQSDIVATPTPVGTLSAGVNTISGSVSLTWNASGVTSGDGRDVSSFIVPPGLAVTRIELAISDFNCDVPGCSTFGQIAGIQRIPASNSIYILFGFGGAPTPIGPGTYTTELSVGPTLPFRAASGSYSYQFRITAIAATNDTCQFATPITLGATPFNNSAATTDGLPHAAACTFFNSPSMARDLWYTFTPAVSGALTVSTCGSTFDTELNIYTGNTCPGTDATLLACNDDNAVDCLTGSTQSRVVVTATAGQTYLIRVGGYDGNASAFGPGTLTLSQVTTGACCNRWTGDCVIDTQADCAARGLRFDGFGSACSPTTCTACAADFDGSGTRNVADIFAFLSSWFAGCP